MTVLRKIIHVSTSHASVNPTGGLAVAFVNHNPNEAAPWLATGELVIATSNPDGKTICIRVVGSVRRADDGCLELKTAKTKGVGVGLSIAISVSGARYRRFLAAPGAGWGSVFSFILPLQEAELAS